MEYVWDPAQQIWNPEFPFNGSIDNVSCICQNETGGDPCASMEQGEYSLGLHIGAIFIVLGVFLRWPSF
jgi:hypothetical protein